jgi:glycosyltransferase involved in cell wall biosynthesis
LDSVFAQSYPHYQVIVINDGSPDTPELELTLAPYLKRVIYITHETNHGPNGARNTGLRHAASEFVALLDSDDIWLPNYLAEQVHFLRERPEYDLVYCNARFFGDSIYTGKEYMDVCPSNGEATSLAIIARQCHVFVSVLARKEALLSVGFDESFRRSEDFECWIRFTAAGHRIGYQRKVLVLYRRHAESNSANPITMAQENIRVLTKSISLWDENSPETRCLLQQKAEKEADMERLQGKLALRLEDFAAAGAHFQRANGYFRSAKLSCLVALVTILPRLVRTAYRLRGRLVRAHRDLDLSLGKKSG